MKGKRLGLMAAGDADGDSVREGMLQELCGGDSTGATCTNRWYCSSSLLLRFIFFRFGPFFIGRAERELTGAPPIVFFPHVHQLWIRLTVQVRPPSPRQPLNPSPTNVTFLETCLSLEHCLLSF